MRIAIVKLSAIGDIVHSMIVLQFIRSKCPELIIDWFVDADLKDVLENNPHINKIHSIKLKEAKKKKSLKLFINEITKLRRLKKYDLVIDMQNLIKSAFVTWIVPSVKTIGLDNNSSREKLASIFYNQKLNIAHSSNVINRNISIINSSLGIDISDMEIINKEPFLFFQKNRIFSFLNDKPNILLIPGASFNSKIYPAEYYAEIANKMHGNVFVVWGSKSERLIAEKIQSLSHKVVILDLLSFNELKSFISNLDLVIGGDTGPVHMAWALGVASITIFGPTPGYRNTYQTKINLIIESQSHVDPYNINKNDFSIQKINSDDIVKMAKKLLEVK